MLHNSQAMLSNLHATVLAIVYELAIKEKYNETLEFLNTKLPTLDTASPWPDIEQFLIDQGYGDTIKQLEVNILREIGKVTKQREAATVAAER